MLGIQSKPKSFHEVLVNAHQAIDRRLPLGSELYNADSLLLLSGGDSLSWSDKSFGRERVSVLGFGRISESIDVNGSSYDALGYKVWRYTLDAGKSVGHLQILFRKSDTSLSFENVESVFGSGWVSSPAQPILMGHIVQEPTHPRGNAGIQYRQAIGTSELLTELIFDAGGNLYLLTSRMEQA